MSKTIISIRYTYYLLLALFWFSTGLPLSLSVLLVQQRGLDLFQVGSMMAFYSLTIVLLEVPTGGLADAVGRKPITLIAYGVLALSNLIVLFAFSYAAILSAFIMMGVGRALSSGALDAWFIFLFKD